MSPSKSPRSKIAGRSPFHFTRLFTRFVGVSPHRYVVHFAMATSGRACSSCPIRLGRCRGAHRLCRPKPSHALGPARSRRFPDGTGRLSQRAGIFKISGSLFPKSRSRGAELPRSRRQTRKNNMTDLIERRFHRLGTQLSGLLSRPSDDDYATTTAIWGKAETTPLSDEKN